MNDVPSKGRRSLLKAVTLGVPSTVVGVQAYARQAPLPQSSPGSHPVAAPPDTRRQTFRFFNTQEAETMDAVVARLIPADDLGPGAKEAGVTSFLDDQLAGAWGNGDHFYRQGPFEPGTPEQGYQLSFTPAEMFRHGLMSLNQTAQKQHGSPFAALPADQQDALLQAMQAGELDFSPLPAAVFFAALLDGTMEGFFSDPLYGGNADMVGWKLVGFPGAHASFANDIERHGVIWAGEPVSIATSRAHHKMDGNHG